LYRKSPVSPLWIDLSVFTATGFSEALAAKIEKIQDNWLALTLTEDRREISPAYHSAAASD